MRACLARTKGAWEQLLERFSGLAWSIACQRLSAAEAAEVVQSAFVAVWMKLAELRDPMRLTAWIASIVRREVSSFCRKQRLSRRVLSLSSDAEISDRDRTEDSENLEIYQIVRDAIDAIPERFQPLARSMFLEHESQNYDKIAAELGLPRGSLGPMRKRILEQLRRNLAPVLRDSWYPLEIEDVETEDVGEGV
ncbi:MAG: RNA polymerase sigma factor [Planctomycetota bacterium]